MNNRFGSQRPPKLFQDDFHLKPVKKPFKLPNGYEDKLPIVILVGVLIIAFVPLYLLGSFSASDSNAPPTSPLMQARLQVPIGPTKKFAPGSETTLTQIEVSVRNVGRAVALNVLVDAEVNSTWVAMEGPLKIGPGEEGLYTLKTSVEVPKNMVLNVATICWNCPHSPGPPPPTEEIERFRREIESGKSGR